MESKFKRVIFLFGAVAYVVFVIFVMNKLIDPMIVGDSVWMKFVIFIIQIVPLMWLVGRAIDVKDNEESRAENPSQKSWRHDKKSKNRKKYQRPS